METAAVVRVLLLEQKLGKTTRKTLILQDAEKLRRAKETVLTLFAILIKFNKTSSRGTLNRPEPKSN